MTLLPLFLLALIITFFSARSFIDTINKEVKKGLECGITVENYADIKQGDVIEAYEMVEIKR